MWFYERWLDSSFQADTTISDFCGLVKARNCHCRTCHDDRAIQVSGISYYPGAVYPRWLVFGSKLLLSKGGEERKRARWADWKTRLIDIFPHFCDFLSISLQSSGQERYGIGGYKKAGQNLDCLDGLMKQYALIVLKFLLCFVPCLQVEALSRLWPLWWVTRYTWPVSRAGGMIVVYNLCLNYLKLRTNMIACWKVVGFFFTVVVCNN